MTISHEQMVHMVNEAAREVAKRDRVPLWQLVRDEDGELQWHEERESA